MFFPVWIWLRMRSPPGRTGLLIESRTMRKPLLIALTIVAALTGAVGQTYPSRPVTFIVPFAAGGPADVLARTLAEAMRAPLGQPVIVENVVGAGGSVGVRRAVQAAADGYTVSVGNWSTHVING